MQSQEPERKYVVVKYFDQWPLGRSRKVLQDHLTLEEAKKLAEDSNLHLSSEDVTIECEEATGVDAEIAGELNSQHGPDDKIC